MAAGSLLVSTLMSGHHVMVMGLKAFQDLPRPPLFNGYWAASCAVEDVLAQLVEGSRLSAVA